MKIFKMPTQAEMLQKQEEFLKLGTTFNFQ